MPIVPGFDVRAAARNIAEMMPDQWDAYLIARGDVTQTRVYWQAQRLPRTEMLDTASHETEEDMMTQPWRLYMDMDSPQTHFPTPGDKLITTADGVEETWEIFGNGQVTQNMGQTIFNIECKLDV